MAASTAASRGARRRCKVAHHFSNRSSNATCGDTNDAIAATAAIHARTSRTRANAPAYRAASRSPTAPFARARVFSTRCRDALFARIIARLRSLSVMSLSPSWRSHDKSTGA